MKTLTTIAVLTLTAASFNAVAQQEEKSEKQQSERSRSMQGIRTDNELKDDRQQVPSNEYRNSGKDSLSNQSPTDSAGTEVIQKNQDQGLGSDDDGNGLTNENNTTQDGEDRNNAPAVIQRTTSESGSPAVLSGDNGRERDGTNNVQRATPNMAGAKEVSGGNLSKKNTAEKNQNTEAPRVRKQEEQPAATPAEEEQDSAVANEQTATMTNAEPATESAKPMSSKEKRKAKRDERRSRRKE